VGHLERSERPSTVGGMFADSVVGRAVAIMFGRARRGGRTALNAARRVDSALGRVPLPDPDPADEERVKTLLASSRLVMWIDSALEIPGRAWRSSAVRRWTQPSLDAVRLLPPAGRIRLLGWMLVVATITHIVLVLAIAEPVGWPTWVAWLSFVSAAAVAACWPSEVLAAWATSKIRQRLSRREPRA
jgi:hypothetical protein